MFDGCGGGFIPGDGGGSGGGGGGVADGDTIQGDGTIGDPFAIAEPVTREVDFAALMTISAALDLAGVQTSTAIGTQNDFPLDADVTVLGWNGAGPATITGLVGTASRLLVVENRSPTEILTLADQDPGSAAPNRIITTSGIATQLGPMTAAVLLRDAVVDRWLLIASNTPLFGGNVTVQGILTVIGALVASSSATIAGTLTANGSAVSTADVRDSGTVTPATITGAVNNYAPTGATAAYGLRQGQTGNAVVSGMTGGVAGRFRLWENISAFFVTFTHDDSNSSIANRYRLPSGSSWYLPPNASALFWYDATSTVWQLVGGTGATYANVPLTSTGMVPWSSDTTPFGTVDFAIARGAAGVGQANNGTLNTFRDWYTRTTRASVSFLLGSATTGATWTSGSGSPEGVQTAVIGSLYSQLDGLQGTELWFKASGTGNTGWFSRSQFAGLTASGSAIFNGPLRTNSSATVDGTLVLSSVITPAALGAGPTANYAPGGSNASGMRQDLSANAVVSGLSIAQTASRVITIYNISSTFTLTLTHDDAASTAANRFLLPSAVNYVIQPLSSAQFWYDGLTLRYRMS